MFDCVISQVPPLKCGLGTENICSTIHNISAHQPSHKGVLSEFQKNFCICIKYMACFLSCLRMMTDFTQDYVWPLASHLSNRRNAASRLDAACKQPLAGGMMFKWMMKMQRQNEIGLKLCQWMYPVLWVVGE